MPVLSRDLSRSEAELSGAKTPPAKVPIGSVVFCRYLDAVRFEGADAGRYRPWTLELVGWLDYQDKECIRVVSERYAEPSILGNARLRSTGVCIPQSTIIELKRLIQHIEPETE
jgi:hypothetical protein